MDTTDGEVVGVPAIEGWVAIMVSSNSINRYCRNFMAMIVSTNDAWTAFRSLPSAQNVPYIRGDARNHLRFAVCPGTASGLRARAHSRRQAQDARRHHTVE